MNDSPKPAPGWNGRPPARVLAWVISAVAPGSRLVRVRALGGGSWLATHLVVLGTPAGERREIVLRRWARPGWDAEQPVFTAAGEAAVLASLEATAIPAPRVLALDATGEHADVPAIVQTRLRGRPPTYPATRRDAVLRQLAEAAVAIHDLDAGLSTLARPYRPYFELTTLIPLLPPPASGRPELWRRAVETVTVAPDGSPARFIHRDFHPGNTLWSAGVLSGIVDWTAASWGPPAADLAHLRANLGVGHDPEIADRALALYRSAGGSTTAQAWWDVRTLLDWVPLLGERLGTGDGLERVERWLAHVVG